MESIIRSLLDTDLYKLTQQQAVLRKCPDAVVSYNFIDRKPTGKMDAAFMDDLVQQIDYMRYLRLDDDQAHYLCGLGIFSLDYVDHLYRYRFDPAEVLPHLTLQDGVLKMPIPRKPWRRAILWEVPLLALVSELYFRHNPADDTPEANEARLKVKGEKLSGLSFSEFGTRRRRSYEYQNQAVEILKNVIGFQGTSNVHLAYTHNLPAIGTMAHEWIMGMSVLEGLRHANRHALRAWQDVYDGKLGIALTDTFGTEAFWEDFRGNLSQSYNGVRHDSADPHRFTRRTLDHYQHQGIDPKTKKIIYSDSLNPDKCQELDEQWGTEIRQYFGIGTNLTNDVPNSPALNIVIKLSECNGVPVVKLSDTLSKATGDADAIRDARWTFFGTPLDAKQETATSA